jgi:hypothetical protein
MFAMSDNNHHQSGHVALWVKAPPMVREILVRSDGKRCFVAPYMGPKAWVGIRLDYKLNWDEVAAILKDGYLMSAPKRLGGRVSSAMDEAPRHLIRDRDSAFGPAYTRRIPAMSVVITRSRRARLGRTANSSG